MSVQGGAGRASSPQLRPRGRRGNEGPSAVASAEMHHLRPVTGNPHTPHASHIFLFRMASQGQLWEPDVVRLGREPHARLPGSLTLHEGRLAES